LNSTYTAVAVIFCIGLYCVIAKRNLLKIIIGLDIMEGAVLLLLVASGYREGGVPPILPASGPMVNPIPQAFTLTAIVVGASFTALALSFVIMLHRHYGSVDIDKIRGLRG